MIKNDQKVVTNQNSSPQMQKYNIDLQAKLGYEVVSVTTNNNFDTITYKRSRNLKFHTRLLDLEQKINKLDNLIDKNNNNLIKLQSYVNNNLAKEKKAARGSLIMAIVFLITQIVFAVAFKINLINYIKTGWWLFLIIIGLAVTAILWLKLIEKRSDDSSLKYYHDKLIKQKNLLIDKASKISKEEKE